jgi:hypothetical protein
MPFLALPFCRLREASTIGSQAWTQSADCNTPDRIAVETTNNGKAIRREPGCSIRSAVVTSTASAGKVIAPRRAKGHAEPFTKRELHEMLAKAVRNTGWVAVTR